MTRPDSRTWSFSNRNKAAQVMLNWKKRFSDYKQLEDSRVEGSLFADNTVDIEAPNQGRSRPGARSIGPRESRRPRVNWLLRKQLVQAVASSRHIRPQENSVGGATARKIVSYVLYPTLHGILSAFSDQVSDSASKGHVFICAQGTRAWPRLPWLPWLMMILG